MHRIYNFSAGPAVLPVQVLQEASKGVLEINNSGMSILEVSHRGKDYEEIHHETTERLLRVLGLSAETHTALFLGGGASMQFAMLPMNFLSKEQTADYINTGEWSSKAIKDAKRFGNVNVAGSSEDSLFSVLPTQFNFTTGARYVHITTNNTIEGTEFFPMPYTAGVPLVADCSSDIFAVNRDHHQFDLMYAGAQKNAGPAGVTMVIARKVFLETATEDLPPMLSYKTHAKADSLYNTPPAFSIYVVGLVLKWIEEQGGLGKLEARNRHKAALIYDALDSYPDVYEPAVKNIAHRSLMNITFRLRDKGREKQFLEGAEAKNMQGLKGHRSVGGFRASVYNAFPEDGCEALAEYLKSFVHTA